MVRFALAVVAAVAWAVCPLVFSQAMAVMPGGATVQAADPASGIVFDVVSIKPVEEHHNGHLDDLPDGDGIQIVNSTLYEIVRWSYNLGRGWRLDQFRGTPKWFTVDNFDIHAKVAETDVAAWLKLSDEQRRIIFRKVLAERFGLVDHFVDVDTPVYNLVIAKGGLKIKEAKAGVANPSGIAKPGDPGSGRTGPWIGMRYVSGQMVMDLRQQTMSSFANSFLGGPTGRHVIDKTGLTGTYDFSLEFSWDQMSAAPVQPGQMQESGPSIFTALPEQLGLKLEPARGAVPLMVIDSVHEPTQD